LTCVRKIKTERRSVHGIHRHQQTANYRTVAGLERPLLQFSEHDIRALRVRRGLLDPRAFSPQEEVYHIIEGELELAIGGVTQRLGPGFVGVVPSNTPHAVKAISSGKVIVVDYPLREAPVQPSNHR
jgi:mannose-6-phosphate isomerase-like protein (cupin superfamily)